MHVCMYSFLQTSKLRKLFHIELYESEEDEWSALEKRLQQEGLSNSLSVEGKLIYVWRWLVDAENNLKTTRKMLDKLQMKHNQEMEEVEFFVEKLKDVTDQRVAKVEEEKQQIINKLQNIKDTTAESTLVEISEMLKQEGLDEIALSPISEQIAYLLVERSRLIEEIAVERRKRKGIPANLTDNIKLNSTQTQKMLDEQKADYEEELKFQQDLAKQIKEQMKKYHEDEMRQIQKNLRQTQKKVEELNSDNSNCDVKETLQKKCKELEERVTEMNDRLKVMKKAMRELENENENLIYKLSEAMAECDEQETLLRKMRMNSVLENSSNPRSPSLEGPSPLVSPSSEHSELTQQSVERDSTKLQQNISVEEVEILRESIKELEEQLIKSSEKYEYIVTKYQHQRLNQKSRLQKIRDKYHKNNNSLKEQVKKLEREINIANAALNKEKLHRTKVIQDLQSLQNENRTLYEKVLEQEEVISEKTRELSLLNMKSKHLEEKNYSLLQQLSILNKRNSLQSLILESSTEPLKQKTLSKDENSLELPTDFNTPLQESTKILEKLSSVLSAVQLSFDKQDEIGDSIHKSKDLLSQIDSGIENLSIQAEKPNGVKESDQFSFLTNSNEDHPYQSSNLCLVSALEESQKLQTLRRHSQSDVQHWKTSSSTPYSLLCQELPKTWPSSAISSPNKESVPIQNKIC